MCLQITTKNVPNISAGSGSLQNQKIAANSNTTINFPLSLNLLNTKADPSNLVLKDVTQQCGWASGGSGSGNKLSVNVKVDARISVLSLGIPIPVTVPIDISCPDLGSISGALSQLTGGDASSLISGLLGSGGGSAAAAALGNLGGRAESSSLLAHLADHIQRRPQAYEPGPAYAQSQSWTHSF